MDSEKDLVKLDGVCKELDDQGYLENVVNSFNTVEAMMREVGQTDPANFSFLAVYNAIKNQQS